MRSAHPHRTQSRLPAVSRLLMTGTSLTAALAIGGSIFAPSAAAAEQAASPRVDTAERCWAGGGFRAENGADCAEARASILPQIGDTILPLLGLELPIDLADFNTAMSVPFKYDFLGIPVIDLPGGSARISGRGYTTAVSALEGSASASADTWVSGAIALGIKGSSTASSGLFGVSVAASVPEITGINLKAVQALLGDPPGTAQAASTLGIAIAITTSPRAVRSNVFGGMGTAISDTDASADRVTCVALYCRSSIDGGPTTTSLLFLLGSDHSGDEDSPTIYRLRNPFSLRTSSVVTPGLEKTLTAVGPLAGTVGVDALQGIDIGAATGTLKTPIAIDFSEDVIRVVSGGSDHQFRIESDLPILRELLQIIWPAPRATDTAVPTALATTQPAPAVARSSAASSPVATAAPVTASALATSSPVTSTPAASTLGTTSDTTPSAANSVTTTPSATAEPTSATTTTAPDTETPTARSDAPTPTTAAPTASTAGADDSADDADSSDTSEPAGASSGTAGTDAAAGE